MLAACKQCSYQITVATVQAAEYFTCPACGGRLALVSVADAPPLRKSAAIQTDAGLAPVKSGGDLEPTIDELSISLEQLQDADRWRAVARGLRLIYVAWWIPAYYLAGLIIFGGVFAALWVPRQQPPMFGIIIGGAFVLTVFLSEIFHVAGLIYCCQMPAHSGGRPQAAIATGLNLAGCVAFGGMILLMAIDEHRLLPIALMSLAISLLAHLAGVICWLYAARSLAIHFGNILLARSAVACMFAVAFWAGTLPLTALIRDDGQRVPVALMLFLIWNISCFVIVYLWLMRIVKRARRTVEISLELGLAPGEVQRLQMRRRLDMGS